MTTPGQADTVSTSPQPQASNRLPRRVAVLSDAIAERNGVGAYYCDLVSQLQHRLEAIELYCPRQQDRRPWHLPMPGDATQALHMPPICTLQRALDRLDPHVIVAPTPGAYGLLAAHEAKRRKVPLIVCFHTSFEDIVDLYFSRPLGYATQAMFNGVNAHLFKRSQLVLANTERIAKTVVRRYATEVELMGTPLAPMYLDIPTTPIEECVDSVLFAGRLAAEKNIDAVIEAASTLPHIQFHIAGDGPERDTVIRQCHALSNLRYHGWLSRALLCRLIDSIEVTVLPSHFETFGTIAMEVMARERLVLVSPQCGIAAWPRLREGLCVQQSGESLTDAIRRIAAMTPGTRSAISQHARECALDYNRWTIDRWIESLSVGA